MAAVSQHELLVESELSEEDDLSADCKILRLERQYIPRVLEIERSCYPNPWSEELVRAEFGKDISMRFGVFCRKDERLLGYSFNYLLPDELHVLNVAIQPSLQGRGLGRMLLAYVLASGIREGVRRATLEVRVSNIQAQKLYRSFGFKIEGMRRRYYRDNGEDALVLAATLSRQQLSLFEQMCVSCL